MATDCTANPDAAGTRPWDAAEHIETDADAAAYLEAALDEGDAELVVAALDDIARAKGLADRERLAGPHQSPPD